MAVSVSNVNLTERVCHLTSKIYREISCISGQSRHERIITIHGLDHWLIQASTFSSTPQDGIALSWNLLAWISVEGGILSSFTNFITSPKLSGPLYISPGVYHSQIIEYSLEKINK